MEFAIQVPSSADNLFLGLSRDASCPSNLMVGTSQKANSGWQWVVLRGSGGGGSLSAPSLIWEGLQEEAFTEDRGPRGLIQIASHREHRLTRGRSRGHVGNACTGCWVISVHSMLSVFSCELG